MNEEQDKLVNQIRQQLDRQAGELDSETLSRLRQARAHALAAGERKNFLHGFGGSVAAFASLAVLAVAVWLAAPIGTSPEMPPQAQLQVQVLDDVELLASAEELEFYEEEIEFYYWLEAQDAQG